MMGGGLPLLAGTWKRGVIYNLYEGDFFFQPKLTARGRDYRTKELKQFFFLQFSVIIIEEKKKKYVFHALGKLNFVYPGCCSHRCLSVMFCNDSLFSFRTPTVVEYTNVHVNCICVLSTNRLLHFPY